ncbi:MAG: DUF5675 family protein [Flavobacteriia bacterium]
MELVLVRKYDTSGTNGSIFIDNECICHSIELPWKTNQKRISCVPEGRYELVKRYSAKFKWHLMLMNVPERAYILIHPANNALKELKGCIAPVTVLAGAGKGYASVSAMNKLCAIVFPVMEKKEKVYLNIQSNLKKQ